MLKITKSGFQDLPSTHSSEYIGYLQFPDNSSMQPSLYARSKSVISMAATSQLTDLKRPLFKSFVSDMTPFLELTIVQQIVRRFTIPLFVPLAVALGGCEKQPYDSAKTVSTPEAVNTAQNATAGSSQLVITYPETSVSDNSAFIQVAENNTTVAVVVAKAVEGSKVIYRLQDGEDKDKFVMDETTGVLSFKTPPDWEQPNDADSNNNYLVLWQVLSSTGEAQSQFLIVQVTDLPD